METKQFDGHTPGPWTVDPEHKFRVRAPGREFPLCDVDYRCGPQEANARLMAAAPTLLRQRDALLAACKRLADAASRRENPMGDPCGLIAAQSELREAALSVRAAIALCQS